MEALLAALVPVLPEMTVGTIIFAFALWRERVHNGDSKRWTEERAGLIAEKREAVKEAREQNVEDDKRKDTRIAGLAEENERLERALDDERAARRAAEDTQTLRMPRHRSRDEGTAS